MKEENFTGWDTWSHYFSAKSTPKSMRQGTEDSGRILKPIDLSVQNSGQLEQLEIDRETPERSEPKIGESEHTYQLISNTWLKPEL